MEKYTIYGKPNCPYCESAKDLLDNKGLDYEYIDITVEGINAVELAKLVNQDVVKTVPQIITEDTYIGGFTELRKSLS